MLAVCEIHALKKHSRLQSRMKFRGFRANVSPLDVYIYIYWFIYLFIYLYKWTNMMISGCYGILKTKSFIWKGEGKTYWWAWQKPSMLHNPCYLLLLTLSDENFGLWTISGLQKCQGASRCYNSNTHVPCVLVRSCFVHLRYLLGSNPGTLLFTAIFSC